MNWSGCSCRSNGRRDAIPNVWCRPCSGMKQCCRPGDGERLVGMLCAMDDGVMTAYIHYLLVAPEYQHCGIGRRLVEIAKERYADYLKIVLIAYTHGTGFLRELRFPCSPRFGSHVSDRDGRLVAGLRRAFRGRGPTPLCEPLRRLLEWG